MLIFRLSLGEIFASRGVGKSSLYHSKKQKTRSLFEYSSKSQRSHLLLHKYISEVESPPTPHPPFRGREKGKGEGRKGKKYLCLVLLIAVTAYSAFWGNIPSTARVTRQIAVFDSGFTFVINSDRFTSILIDPAPPNH